MESQRRSDSNTQNKKQEQANETNGIEWMEKRWKEEKREQWEASACTRSFSSFLLYSIQIHLVVRHWTMR